MLNLVTLTVMFVLSSIAFAIGYFHAPMRFDGRKENMPKSYRLLTALKYADTVLILSLVALILVKLTKEFS